MRMPFQSSNKIIMKKKNASPRPFDEQSDLVSLTDKLYTEFSIEVLEERLETDPLMLSGLFNEITPFCDQCKKGNFDCDTFCSSCHGTNVCACHGKYVSCTCHTAHAECYK